MPTLKDRTGEIRVMRCGMKATIIKYVNSHNITVQSEDGIIIEHRYYGDFEKGKIEHPSNLLDNTKRIGQKNKMNCGMVATIINYRKSNDIDVEFEDGVVIEKRSYQDFLKGKISHPKLKNNDNFLKKKKKTHF